MLGATSHHGPRSVTHDLLTARSQQQYCLLALSTERPTVCVVRALNLQSWPSVLLTAFSQVFPERNIWICIKSRDVSWGLVKPSFLNIQIFIVFYVPHYICMQIFNTVCNWVFHILIWPQCHALSHIAYLFTASQMVAQPSNNIYVLAELLELISLMDDHYMAQEAE